MNLNRLSDDKHAFHYEDVLLAVTFTKGCPIGFPGTPCGDPHCRLSGSYTMSTNNDTATASADNSPGPKECGEKIPDLELPGAGEEGIQMFQLSDFTEEGALILSFYPFDFSPICTNQLCGFRDAEWLAFTKSVDVVGVSVDSAYSHQRFRNEYSLNFPLLTDRLASVAEEFGVKYSSWEDHPAVCKRAVFAIDASRTIRYRWWAEDAEEQPTTDDHKEAIEWLNGDP